MKTSDVKAEYIKTRIAQMLKADPKLTFQQAWTRGGRNREVVVGPKNLSADGLLKMLLLSMGYRSASVRRSSASYR